MNQSTPLQIPSLVPDIRLFGKVNEHMLGEFFRQQSEVHSNKPLVVELSTSGGDADIGRRIAQEIKLWQNYGQREVYFLGKTYVYSAGITIMSAFPRERRFMTSDTLLLIHERKIKKSVELSGALRSCLGQLNDAIAEVESGQWLERDGFMQLVRGSQVSLEELEKKVLTKDWYLTASEALEQGLIGGLLYDSEHDRNFLER